MNDFAFARTFFERVDVAFYHLATLAAIPFARTGFVVPLSRTLDGFDRAIFATIPAMKRYAWMSVMTLSGPKARATTD